MKRNILYIIKIVHWEIINLNMFFLIKNMMELFGFNKVKTYYMGERSNGADDDPADGADVCRGYKDTHKGMVALGYITL